MSAYGSGLSNPSPPIYIDDTKINLVSDEEKEQYLNVEVDRC